MPAWEAQLTLFSAADVTLDMPAFRALFVFSRMLWSLLGLASSGLMVSAFFDHHVVACFFYLSRAHSCCLPQEERCFPGTVEKTTPAKTLSVCSLTLTHLE